MKTKIAYLIILTSLLSGFATAQDTIFLRDQPPVIAKVNLVSPTEIKYHRADQVDGPSFIVARSTVRSIHYANGTIDDLAMEANRPPGAPTENKTVVPKPKAPIDTIPRYVLILKDGTQLRGMIKAQNEKQLVFIDNNIGERTIEKELVTSIKLQFGDAMRVFTMRDGSIITGQIVNKTDEATVVRTNGLGTVSLDAGNIIQVRDAEEATITSSGKIWFKNPNCTRYLFAPSAIQLKKGEGYYQNMYGFGNAWNYGVTDNVTMGGGVIGPMGLYINAKAGFQVANNVHFGGGVLLGNSLFPINGENFGIGMGFSVLTLGNYDHNITVGAGYGFLHESGELGWWSKPLFVANGMARVGKKFALVTENWVINFKDDPFNRGITEDEHYETIFSYAFRYMGQKSTLDAGFLNTPGLIEKGWYVGIPYIGFVFRFGNYKDN
jgi:hypothetical protein